MRCQCFYSAVMANAKLDYYPPAIWKRAIVPLPAIPTPGGHGWEVTKSQMSWNLCGLDLSRLQKRFWNYSPVRAREHARSITAAAWRRVCSELICAVSSVRIRWLMMAFNMRVGIVTLKVCRTDTGKPVEGWRLLSGMGSMKIFFISVLLCLSSGLI